MIVSARPYPNIEALISSEKNFGQTNFEFHTLGREALLNCIIKLGLKRGDEVIIPAYMCESTIIPLRKYGFKILFIDIDENLAIPLNKIQKIITNNNAKALLVVHYFGLTQEIKKIIKLCHDNKIKVIEDASHSLMSQLNRDKMSIRGDAEIFSMRKNLPVSDGGALRINNISYISLKKDNKKTVSIFTDFQYIILRFLEKVLIVLGINIYGNLINNIKIRFRRNLKSKDFKISPEASMASWQLIKYLENKEYLRNSQKKIIQNFNVLSQALAQKGFKLFTKSVKNNIVPQVCIIYDNNGGLVDYLRSKGIGAWRWPDKEMPNEVTCNQKKYPNTVFYDRSLVLIPIHQSLGHKQINYMIKTLSRWQK